MNTKRHLSLVLLGMIIVLPLLTTSCFKKGEEDPFFSIYTRKARVTGEWNITNMESIIKRTYQNDVQTLTTTLVSDLNWSQTIEILGTDSVVEYEGNVIDGRNKVIFDKDGNIKEIYEYEYIVEKPIGDDAGVLRTNYRISTEITGTWNFLNNIDDYKNKERLAIVIEESKETTQILTMEILEDSESTPTWNLDSTYSTAQRYANGQMSTIWELDMLKNKQINNRQNIDLFNLKTVNGGEVNGGALIELGTVTQTLKRD